MRSMFKRWEVFGAIAAATVVLAACSPLTPVTVRVAAELGDMTFEASDTTARSVDLTGYFATETRDELTFSATSSKKSVATASVSGKTLTVTPVVPGSASVTVTAKDSSGSVSQSIAVTVMAAPPTPTPPTVPRPQIIGILPQSVTLADADADAMQYTLGDYFSEAEYSASASPVGVVTASVTAGVLTIGPMSEGNARVRVTATNESGSVHQDIDVRVGDPSEPMLEPPQIIAILGAWDFEADDTAARTFVLSMYFTGATSYVPPTSDNETVATAAEADGVLSITPVGPGVANVTVTATNADGSREQTIRVEVAAPPNMRPTVKKAFPPVRLPLIDGKDKAGKDKAGTWEAKLNDYFADPEKAPLSFTVETKDAKVVKITAPTGYDDDVTIEALSMGPATITVTATDSEAQGTPQTFVITVVASVAKPMTVGNREMADYTKATTRLTVSGAAKKAVDGAFFSAHFSDTDLDTPAGDVLTFTVKYVAKGGTVDDIPALAADKVVATATISPTTWSGDKGGLAKEKFTVMVTPQKGGDAHTILIVATDLSGDKVAKRIEVQVNRAPVAEGPQATPKKLSEYKKAEGLRGDPKSKLDIKLVDTTTDLTKNVGYFHDDDDDALTCSATPSDTAPSTAPAKITLDKERTTLTVTPNAYKATFEPMTVTVSCSDGWDASPEQTFTVSVTSV